MARLLHAIIIGLVGAGIIHILLLFLIPRMVEKDSWTALSEFGEPYGAIRLDTLDDAIGIGGGDPFFLSVACLFDLGEGPVRLNASGHVPFWSASVHDRSGFNVFSLNDRTASDGRMDFVIATAGQMIALRNELPADFADSVFVETDIDQGIAVLRGFVPDPTWEREIAAFLEDVDCTSH